MNLAKTLCDWSMFEHAYMESKWLSQPGPMCRTAERVYTHENVGYNLQTEMRLE